jgi:hypothetical protein
MSQEINLDPKRKHDLTVDEVRSCPWFAHFTDDQAQEVIRTFKELSIIAYDIYRRENQKNL